MCVWPIYLYIPLFNTSWRKKFQKEIYIIIKPPLPMFLVEHFRNKHGIDAVFLLSRNEHLFQ